MESEKIRDLIITLIIIAIGIKIITMIGLFFIPNLELVNISDNIVKSIEAIGNLFIFGMIFLIIILVPLYLSSRSEEKKKEKIEKRIGVVR